MYLLMEILLCYEYYYDTSSYLRDFEINKFLLGKTCCPLSILYLAPNKVMVSCNIIAPTFLAIYHRTE